MSNFRRVKNSHVFVTREKFEREEFARICHTGEEFVRIFDV